MLNRISIATIFAVLVGLFAATTASAAEREPVPPPTDYWQDKGFILMAHQGGEWDFPPNTLFSYKSAMDIGADMIDMDAYVTRDGQIVLTHDLDARNNSNLTDADFGGRHDINDLDLAELKTLDFAYKWSPHDGSSTTPYRGIATSTGTDNPPPTGFSRDDFKIPTFAEVLSAFPDTPINIELKQVAGVDIEDTAEEMASILAAHPGHDENVIINSFGQEMLDAMHAARPEHKSFSGSQPGLLGYVAGDPIVPTPVALEPPDYFNLGGALGWQRTVPLLRGLADKDGYKIYVWGSDHDLTQDTPPFYSKLIEEGADSYNTPDPISLAAYLCTAGIAAMDGSPRCAEQICPEGQEGIAPNDCHYPPCPAGTEGVAPNCTPIKCPNGTEGTPPNCTHGDPATRVTKVSISPAKGKIKAGKKTRVTIKLSATIGLGGIGKVALKSSNRQVKLPKSVAFTKLSSSMKKTITVSATKKAKGKAKITASVQGKKGSATLTVKKAAKKARKAHR